jgi:hypothetical protein
MGLRIVVPLQHAARMFPAGANVVSRWWAMIDQRQDALTYNCPSTGRLVRTAIVTSNAALAKLARVKLSVWCPHCDAPHKIAGRDASVAFALPKAS